MGRMTRHSSVSFLSTSSLPPLLASFYPAFHLSLYVQMAVLLGPGQAAQGNEKEFKLIPLSLIFPYRFWTAFSRFHNVEGK